MFAVEAFNEFWSCPFCHQVPLNPRSNPWGNSSSDSCDSCLTKTGTLKGEVQNCFLHRCGDALAHSHSMDMLASAVLKGFLTFCPEKFLHWEVGSVYCF